VPRFRSLLGGRPGRRDQEFTPAGYGYDQRIESLGSGDLLAAQNVLDIPSKGSATLGRSRRSPFSSFLSLSAWIRSEVEWSAFIDAVRRGSRAAVTLADGVLALACAEPAARSAQSGKGEAHAGNLVGT